MLTTKLTQLEKWILEIQTESLVDFDEQGEQNPHLHQRIMGTCSASGPTVLPRRQRHLNTW